jgi:PHD/YefM family antitoxin component YafN of YafNO toxin-antitoxin module
MVLPAHRPVPVSRFREEIAKHMAWVEHEGGFVWLTRHGRHVAAVIPFYQLEVLMAALDLDDTAKAKRLERDYARHRAARTTLALAEARRLREGLGIGGPERTATALRMEARGQDPWADDPVLIDPSGSARGTGAGPLARRGRFGDEGA